MILKKRPRNLILIGLVTLFLAVACSAAVEDDGATVEDSAGQASTEEPSIQTDSEENTLDEDTPSETEDQGETGSDAPDESQLDQLNLDWTTQSVGSGIKPAVAVDADGVVHVAFLTEADHGALFYASNESGDFELTTVAEGYFYGPVDIALGPDGVPFIAYHDHQDTGFNPALGDEVIAMMQDGAWKLSTVEDDGHDGWDNSIVVDGDGNWHTAAVDPSQFGSSDGVEYATNSGGEIIVTSVSDGPVAYEFGTAIQLNNEGTPGITYYDNVAQTLKYAELGPDGWSVSTVDDDGDAGRYAALSYDSEGSAHISYFVFQSQNGGVVRHAWLDGSGWQIEDVDVLDDVVPGHVGARKITAIVMDENDIPHIAYADQGRIVYGLRNEEGWSVQEVSSASERQFGQLVEMALDSDGNPHLVWFEVENPSPLTGEVIYASGS